jgi:putative permease
MNMISKWFTKTFSDAQVVLLILVVLAAIIALSLFGQMLAPAIAAIVIAFLLDGPIEWLKRKGVRPLIALISVYAGFLLLSIIVLLAVVPPLFSQITGFINDTPTMVIGLQNELIKLQQQFPDFISEAQVQEWLTGLGNEIANLGPRILEYSLTGVTGAITFVIYTVLVPMMVFFFLKDKDALLSWVGSFLPHDKPLLEDVWREVTQRAGDYARGKVYEIIIVGLAAFITYQLLGLRYATLLAVATGLSVIIPYIGAAAVTIPVALVAYFQWGLGSEMAIAIFAYLVLQALDGNLLVPLLFSEVVNLHPNAIIIAVLVFGGLWGFWGVFFAIPLATVANAIIRAWQQRNRDLDDQAVA